jgi:hypothetical protein
MRKLFGYDEGGGRNWINLEHVARVRYDKDKHMAEIWLAGCGDSKAARVELRGDVAAAFAKAMALIEADGAGNRP